MVSYRIHAIPLVVFMAAMLQHTTIADDLYELVYRFMGPIRYGLGMGTILIWAMFATMSGISTVATEARPSA